MTLYRKDTKALTFEDCSQKPEETVEMPTKTSEKSASESEQVPTETRSSMKSEYVLKNDGMTPGGNSQTSASS